MQFSVILCCLYERDWHYQLTLQELDIHVHMLINVFLNTLNKVNAINYYYYYPAN